MNNTDLLSLLHREVVPAIGCTEPICVALCVARAKERLGAEPDAITVRLSKNIYKNAMSVGIPNTGMTGLPIAIALGATVGQSEWGLEVLRNTTPEAVAYAKSYIGRVPIQIEIENNAPDILYVHAIVEKQAETTIPTHSPASNHPLTATATIQGEHTHFVEQGSDTGFCRRRTDGEPTANRQSTDGRPTVEAYVTDTSCHQQDTAELTLRQVYDFAMTVATEDVHFLLEGAEINLQAAEYAFEHKCGHCLGQILRKQDNSIFEQILAYTSGACDARMSGAMVPVMSNSGSGNQGISCSVPVLLYAHHIGATDEQTLRALALSNLTVIYIKQSLGRLSALCGCVVAATGSACGITYLKGGQYMEITYAVKNMIANISGMICDGAKPGCALKVTSGVATAVIAASLAMEHSYPDATEGIIDEDIDQTIHNLTHIGHDGMIQTDDLILNIMTHKCSKK
ncbi:MAG: L-serine ammonia-lyase, iron-sulfur-dependent, subunit alpha [Paludibacteraceae bacterium]|nr:L-serine ammonia-lyase, iron-sulfur-dependent, subunit alpha [Paludibacteraceae bacterium]